ncbi:MAG: PA2169 family four-helix-bundle protein [Chryseolinea sp.]
MNNEKSIDVLNTLIQINNDRIEGYETASKETDHSDLHSLFSDLIETSEKCKAELTEEVQRLGGTPIEGTKTSGKFFRAWMDIKAALTGKDLKAILNSCEFGEDVAVDTYEKAMENDDDDLGIEQRSIIATQYDLIKADHDKIKSLRDNLVEHE